eukprot:6754924-Pyramimonas_sp.AAC.1
MPFVPHECACRNPRAIMASPLIQSTITVKGHTRASLRAHAEIVAKPCAAQAFHHRRCSSTNDNHWLSN